MCLSVSVSVSPPLDTIFLKRRDTKERRQWRQGFDNFPHDLQSVRLTCLRVYEYNRLGDEVILKERTSAEKSRRSHVIPS